MRHRSMLSRLPSRRTLRLLDVPGSFIVNLGTGRGYSVLELLRAYERASGRTLAFEFAPRRAGDVAACYADPALALATLGWRAARDLDAMCADSWRWQSLNPNGFAASNKPAECTVAERLQD